MTHLEDQQEQPGVDDIEQDPTRPDVKRIDGRPGRRGLQLLDTAPWVLPDRADRPGLVLLVDDPPGFLPVQGCGCTRSRTGSKDSGGTLMT